VCVGAKTPADAPDAMDRILHVLKATDHVTATLSVIKEVNRMVLFDFEHELDLAKLSTLLAAAHLQTHLEHSSRITIYLPTIQTEKFLINIFKTGKVLFMGRAVSASSDTVKIMLAPHLSQCIRT
jgi:TATA-box binding protein (TBP) (component of TFIID and TFIIIB)